MAKPDWGALQQRFLSAHAKTGISPKDWCEAQGLKYSTAKRYIKIANSGANSQKKTANKTANSQKPKQRKSRPDMPSQENCESPAFADSPGAKPIRGTRNAPPTNAFTSGNQHALKHGGYGRRLLLSDAIIEDVPALTLDDELFWLRAANLTAAENIGRWRVQQEDAETPEAKKALLDNIGAAEKAMHRNTARIESLEYTKAAIAKAYADERLKSMAEVRGQFDMEQEQTLAPLETRRRQLVNEKAEAEIENIRSGKNDSNLIVVHNALQVPGAMQPTSSDSGDD
jgi:hypothetical protein